MSCGSNYLLLGTPEHYLFQWNTAHFILIEWACLVENISLTVKGFNIFLTERCVLKERNNKTRRGKNWDNAVIRKQPRWEWETVKSQLNLP